MLKRQSFISARDIKLMKRLHLNLAQNEDWQFEGWQ